jgi:hypothetical protein
VGSDAGFDSSNRVPCFLGRPANDRERAEMAEEDLYGGLQE